MTVSKDRLAKMREIAKKRQFGLRVVLEELENRLNISAICRTCDAVGVQFLHVVHRGVRPIVLDKRVSAGSYQWLKVIQHPTIEDCLKELKEMGFRIYCTHVDQTAKDFTEVDYIGKVAIVFGNEAHGVSEGARKLADERIVIPQVGFVNSLNVAAAVAVILYEAFKQRRKAGLYENPELSEEEQEELVQMWLHREKAALSL
ncbi:MAG: RNA methyltransferase [Armatimonadetes bacterium]|nr:RNA methyltransferase [Armatimonadota bacterium]MDW8027159.1 RNA methyltransferase [Armatimonadota bacterium]